MKIIKGFLITIIVAMLCVFVAFFIWWMDPLFDTSGKKLTYEELRKLAESFQDISNVYVKNGTSDSEYFEYYKKDDTIMQHKYQSGELRGMQWNKIGSKGKIVILPEKNLSGFFIIEDIVSKQYNINSYLPDVAEYDSNKIENYTYTFLGKTKINDRDTLVAKFLDCDRKFHKKLFYIDEETGFIVKEIDKEFPFKTNEYVFEFKTGVVTDEDVKELNYADYEGYYYVVDDKIVSGDIEINEVKDNQDLNTEFALLADGFTINLNSDISTLNMEAINVKEDSGDGFQWKDYLYEDAVITALITDDNTESIIKITTTSDNYKTPRGIKVGDNLELLKELYKDNLVKGLTDSNETYYIYDSEDDIGFNRIYFYLENDNISKIEVINGIDG